MDELTSILAYCRIFMIELRGKITAVQALKYMEVLRGL